MTIATDKDKIKCGLCDCTIGYKGSSTSSAKKHLKRKHEIDVGILASSKKKSADDNGNVAKSSAQPKLQAFMSANRKLDVSSLKYKTITYNIAKCIFVDLRPLSIVEDEGFRALLQCAENGRYVIPSRASFRNNILPTYYNRCREVVLENINKYKKQYGNLAIYSITTDGWTSSNNTSYITYVHSALDEPRFHH